MGTFAWVEYDEKVAEQHSKYYAYEPKNRVLVAMESIVRMSTRDIDG